MYLICNAILGALGQLSERVIKDSYEALKAVIAKKFGANGDLVEAVEKLEKKPDSAGRRETLKEELVEANAEQDEDVMQATAALVEQLKLQSNRHQIVQQTVTGNQNILSGTGTVNVNFGNTKQ